MAALVAASAVAVSLISFLYLSSHRMTNNYGDGVAHVNIARKVVDSPDDSLWQRYLQIGSPWLPLQTVLMLPLVVNDSLWRTGAAGSIVSMVSFVIAVVALFLLASECYGCPAGLRRPLLPLIAAGILCFNPSALYMQATPMTETLFMAVLATSVYSLQRWVRLRTARRLVLSGALMALATLSRYEAWPVAALATLVVAYCSGSGLSRRFLNASMFALIAACGPVYWLWHNWAIYGNALEFLTGPNSARGLYLQNRAHLGWSRLFVGNAPLDLALMIASVAVCAGPLVLMLGLTGFLKSVLKGGRRLSGRAPALLLGVPFVFHVVGLYRGEIQVFPFSFVGLLNVRYGVPHVLAVALLAPGTILLFKPVWRRMAVVGVCILVALQYWQLTSDGPAQLAVYQEGFRNGVNSRVAREHERLSDALASHPPSRMIVMYTGALGPAVTHGGLRFSDIIHEGTSRWHTLSKGIPKNVRTLIVEDGDPLDDLIHDNQSLSKQLGASFAETYNKDRIRVFERRD